MPEPESEMAANHAGARLFELITQIINAVDKENLGGKPAWSGFGVIFGTRTRYCTMRTFLGIERLMHEVAEKIKKIKGDRAGPFLVWYPDLISRFWSTSLGEPMNVFRHLIDDKYLYAIEVCDVEIGACSEFVEPKFSPEHLDKMLHHTRQLIHQINEDEDLPEQMKKYLLDHAHLIEQALTDYQLLGMDALKRGLAGLVGTTVLEGKDNYEESQKSEKGMTLWGLVSNLVILVGAINMPPQLESAYKYYFPSPTDAKQVGDNDPAIDEDTN